MKIDEKYQTLMQSVFSFCGMSLMFSFSFFVLIEELPHGWYVSSCTQGAWNNSGSEATFKGV
jgi:hypothetical protein